MRKTGGKGNGQKAESEFEWELNEMATNGTANSLFALQIRKFIVCILCVVSLFGSTEKS